jgi:Zn-dependent metalloprotease
MKTCFTLFLFFGLLISSHSQSTFKNIPNTPYVQPQPIQVNPVLKSGINPNRIATGLSQNQLHSLRPSDPSVLQFRILSSGSFWIDMKTNHLWQSRASISDVIEKVVQTQVQKMPWALEWVSSSEQTDQQGQTHIRVQQNLAGHPIKGQDMVLHIKDGELKSLNGFAWTGSLPKKLPAALTSDDALGAAKQFLVSKAVKFQSAPHLELIQIPDDQASLIWIPKDGKLVLAYEVKMYPNAIDHWTVYVNASTLEIMSSLSEKCALAPLQLWNHVPILTRENREAENNTVLMPMPLPLLDGATTTNDQDLLGQNRVVNAYQVGTTFFMVDASRNSMYQPAQSQMPNDPLGVIWTIDAQNTSPQLNDFNVVHCTNTNNNWKSLEVSAHFNAGRAFEYYINTFGRNSINGTGGNIISIINVTDENDQNMDNAFWSQTAMYYGNGNVAFTALAKGLDVAGHEMSHGVIQSTANLEYLSQSGALNESYADVFGSLIDRDDWRMGEDVVNLSFFPSGALRDLSNPHNGGNGPNDNGWQPAHMNEYQNLPETPDGDNGGVHVNSGIPNRAYFLFANVVGKDKAEKVYYKALTDYLVKSSQFIDMRNAVEKAATDLFGAGSTEVNAAKSAFDQVGIGGGGGDDHQDDIDPNNGADFILATDESESDLYFVPPTNPGQVVKMNVPAPISRPSFTDDGAFCVYVDNENNLIVINFNWANGLDYEAFYIENNPQGLWRNIAVSKDGTKIAFTTSNLRNEIDVFDFENQGENLFTLFNPTTGEGIESGDVLYPDALEWDYSGEYVMYDALNRIESSFGNGIEFWDISFLNAWDQSADQFGNGLIDKLYSGLPENISIGNPSFAKNSPYIITFDFVEDYFDNFGNPQSDYWVIGANVQDGNANNIFHNTTVGYPSYSRLDDKVVFTYDDNGNLLLGTIDIQANDKTLPVDGTDVVLITGAQKGVWFNVGIRDFTATKEIPQIDFNIYPQPANEFIKVVVDQQSNLPTVYEITDMTGRIMSAGEIQQDRIDIHALPAGPYVIELHDGQKMGRKMMVKQ